MSDLLDRMAGVLDELADETTEIQHRIAPLAERRADIPPDVIASLQRLDRHAQYLVELGRFSAGLSRTTQGRAISAPALCRLVRLPSLRNRFLQRGTMAEPGGEEGKVSFF